MKSPSIVVQGVALVSFLKCIDQMRSEGLGISRIVLAHDANGTVTLYPRIIPSGKKRKKIPLRVIEGGRSA